MPARNAAPLIPIPVANLPPGMPKLYPAAQDKPQVEDFQERILFQASYAAPRRRISMFSRLIF